MPDLARRLLACSCLLALALPGCGDDAPSDAPIETEAPAERGGPPGALWDVVDELRAGGDVDFHPSDGGGRAWLEPGDEGPPRASAGAPGSFTVVYEVGALGVAHDGAIHFQVAPFWGWSTPQIDWEEGPGYTRVEPSADDIELEIGTLDDQLLGIHVTGRSLEPGEILRITYGAGPAGATADRYAEGDSRFWIAVDGDGDGVRRFLVDSPGVAVGARAPARLHVTLPTVARPGETVRVHLALLDAVGNAGVDFTGDVALETTSGLEIETPVSFAATDGGVKIVTGTAAEEGVKRVVATTSNGIEAVSNPLLVSRDGPRVLWADLHGHSSLSDGTGLPAEYFRYARDVSALDVIALTDHDHWGILPLDRNPQLFDEIGEQVRRFHEPGRFVTLHGYEWTSWIHGHRHVIYFDDDPALFSSLDPEYESPTQLWAALAGRDALTFAHHSAGGPIRTNWDIPPDPVLEPLTEIVSVHGSSEALDSPASIYNAVPGNFVRDVLDRGYQLGFVGSGDTHDGHPGLGHLGAPAGGLAAVLAEEHTRESVLAALRARRVYATSGARILLRTALGAHRMGAIVPVGEEGSVSESLFVHVVAETPLERVDLVRSGAVVDSLDTEGRLEVTLQRDMEELESGEYVYVRAVQEDGLAAWSSPVFFE